MVNFDDRLKALYSNNEFSKIIALHHLQKKKFASPLSQHVLGISHLKQGNYKVAIKYLSKLCRTSPNDERYHHLAVSHLENHNLDLAETNFKMALTLNPANYDCLEGLAAIYTKKLMPERAEEILLQMLELKPHSSQVLINLAVIKNAKLDYFSAQELLEKVDNSNCDARYHEAYGDTLAGLHKNAEALEEYQRAYAYSNNSRLIIKINSISRDYTQINSQHISIGSLSDALSILQIQNADNQLVGKAVEFIEHYSGPASDYALIATHLLKIEHIEGAKNFALKSNKLNENATAYCILGILASRNENFSAACAYFFKALEYDDSDADTYNNLALALWKTHNLEAAIINYNKALELRPRFVQALCNLALVYKSLAEKTNDVSCIETAKKLTNEALLIDPNNVEAKFNLSLLSLTTGHLQLGFQLYENRFYVPNETAGHRKYKEPKVSAITSSKMTTLLWEEQGLGDTVMFAKLIPEALKYYENLIVEVDPRLVTIFQRSFPKCSVRATSYSRDTGEYVNDFDQHLPMGDLLVHLFNPQMQEQAQYLCARSDLTLMWEEKLLQLSKGKKIIGLQWTSGLRTSLRNIEYTSIEDWKNLILDEDNFVVSLNYHNISSEIKEDNMHLFERLFIPNFDQKNDLEQTFGLISCLDFAVTPASAPGVFASSLNIPNLTFANTISEWNFGLVKKTPFCRPLFNNNTAFSLSDSTEQITANIMKMIQNK